MIGFTGFVGLQRNRRVKRDKELSQHCIACKMQFELCFWSIFTDEDFHFCAVMNIQRCCEKYDETGPSI